MALVITGARAIILLSGTPVLFAGGVSVQHENRLDEIPQLDDLEVAEYAENGHRCTISVNLFKLASDANVAGQAIENDAASFGFDDPAEFKKILLQPEMIIQVYDSILGIPIYVGYGGKFAGGAGQMNARGIWEGSWTFRCRRGTGI